MIENAYLHGLRIPRGGHFAEQRSHQEIRSRPTRLFAEDPARIGDFFHNLETVGIGEYAEVRLAAGPPIVFAIGQGIQWDDFGIQPFDFTPTYLSVDQRLYKSQLCIDLELVVNLEIIGNGLDRQRWRSVRGRIRLERDQLRQKESVN